jgi:hypothetical protein
MIQLDSTAAKKFAVHLEGYEGIGEGELVKNGDFSELGSDLVQNGDFAQIGSELVTNGDFSDVPLGGELVTDGNFPTPNVNWSLSSSFSIANNKLHCLSDGTYEFAYQSSVFEIGKSYVITFDITGWSLGTIRVRPTAESPFQTASADGSYSFFYVAVENTQLIIERNSGACDMYLENISVKEATNLVTNPNFTDTGSELLTAFSNGTVYPFTTFVTSGNDISSAIVTSDYAAAVSNSIALTIGESYIVTFTYTKNSGDDLKVKFSDATGAGVSYSNAEIITESGTYSKYFTITTTTTGYLQMGTSGSGSLDISLTDVSIKKLGEDWTVVDDTNTFGANGLTMTSTEGAAVKIYQPNVITSSKSYKVTYTIHENGLTGTNAIQYYTGSALNGYDDLPQQSVGTHTFYYTAPSVANDRWYFKLNLAGGSTSTTDFVTISSIVVQELGEGWTIGDKWSLSDEGARLVSSTSDASGLSQSDVFEIGKSYKVTLDAVVNSGTAKLEKVGGAVQFLIDTTKTYVEYFEATKTSFYLNRYTSVSDIYINNISVKEVGQDWTPYTSGTSTVDFPSTGAELNIDALNSNVGIYQSGIFTLGKSYKIVLSMKATSAFDAEILESSGASLISTIGTVSLTTSYQTFTLYHLGTGTYDLFIHRLYTETLGASQTISIQSVIVQQLDPNGYWNINTPPWTLEEGKAVSDGTVSSTINQSGITTLGKTYVAKYDILSYTSGAGFKQRVGIGSDYSDAKTSIATHSTTQIATGNDYIYLSSQNTVGSITNVSVRLKNTGAVTLTLTNQLTEKVTTVNLTPLLSNGRYTEFSYQPTGLIEGMYLIKFTGDSTTYAETLAYITTGTPPLGESEYKEYTTGDDNPDHVYIP